MFEQIEFISVLKFLHVAGLIAGFGSAIYCDLVIIKNGVFKKITSELIETVETFSRAVIGGLTVLWLSGAGLFVVIIEDNPGFWENDKFWAKVVIVSVLTVNGALVHGIVINALRNRVGQKLFQGQGAKFTCGMLLVGAVSFTSWSLPMLFGLAPELSYVVPFNALIQSYLMFIGVVWIGCVIFYWATTKLVSARQSMQKTVL